MLWPTPAHSLQSFLIPPGPRTQVLAHARQALCHWATSLPSLQWLNIYVWQIFLEVFCGQHCIALNSLAQGKPWRLSAVQSPLKMGSLSPEPETQRLYCLSASKNSQPVAGCPDSLVPVKSLNRCPQPRVTLGSGGAAWQHTHLLTPDMKDTTDPNYGCH